LSKVHIHPEVLVAHANARTTVHGRLLIVQRHHQGWTQAHIAAMGISRKSVKTWIERYAAEGRHGLQDRSSRPHQSPTKTPAAVEARIVDLRTRERRGPDELSAQLGVPVRTVSRVPARHGAPHLNAVDPMSGAVLRSSNANANANANATALRYERERPGELMHMDVKKIGRIPVPRAADTPGGGWRAHGRAARDATYDRKAKIGYDYVHSLVGDCSRLAYSEILADEKGPTCAGFLTRAAAYFAVHGTPRIERVMTEEQQRLNVSVVAAQGLRAVGGEAEVHPSALPVQNGKVEQLNRTVAMGWAYRQMFSGNVERAEALAPWIEHYNTRRCHSALGGLPPISGLSPT
jgi:transposase InsO family protein